METEESKIGMADLTYEMKYQCLEQM